MAPEDLERNNALLAAACRADVEGLVVLGAVRDGAGAIVDMTFLEATPAACVLLARSRRELVDRRLLGLFPEAAFNGDFDNYVRVVETGKSTLAERRLITVGPSGDQRCMDIRIMKVDDGVSLAFRDVTEPIGAEAHLIDSDRILHALTSNTRDVVLVVAPDATITYCSPTVTSVLGWEPEDLVGQAQETLVHPGDRAIAATGGGLESGGAAKPVVRMRHRDGRWRWIEPSTNPIDTADGSIAGHVTVWWDVTDRVEADRRIAASEAQLRLLTENTHDVVLMADADCIVTYCSPSVTGLLGWAPEDLVGHPSNDLMHPDDLAALVAGYQPVEPRGEALATARLRHKDGSHRWVESAGQRVLSPDGETLGFTATWRNVSDRVAVESELERRAKVDFLTGLANRSEIIDHIGRITDRPVRTASAVGVLFCDIDHFKDINDQHGHAAGDEVLRTLGERIATTIRVDDRAGRFGGDEILVVLQGVRTLADATAVADKIRHIAAQGFDLSKGAWVAPTISIGATILLPGESVDALIARADKAMYAAKESGRDRVVAVSSPPEVPGGSPASTDEI